MSSGQFNLGGIDGVEGLQAIHPSQLNIGTTASSSERSQSMELLSMQPGSYNMPGMTSPVQNNNTMTSLTSSPYISSIMSDPCNLFSGNMEYGVIGTSDQPDTKDGLEELCPVCGDKVERREIGRATVTFVIAGVRISLRTPHLRVLQGILQEDRPEQEGLHLRGGQELCHW